MPAEIAQAAQLLADARLNAKVIDLPPNCQPASLAEAYLIQDGIARDLPWPMVGWKIGFTDPAQHARWGLSEPGYGRVFAPFFYQSPAVIKAPPRTHIIEVEFAFRLRSDLTPRTAPYEMEDVTSAIDEMYLAIEIVESRYRKPQTMSAYAIIADNLHAGGLVCGASVPHWRDADLARLPVSLYADDQSVAQGSGVQVMGHPLIAMVWLANALARTDNWLRRGQVVTTGSCTGVRAVPANARLRAEFGGLGEIAAHYESLEP